MRFNTLGFSTPRALAFATLAAVSTLGVVSGVFGTFTTSIISGQSCSGYGFFSGYGYGYNCTLATSGGGGGGNASSIGISTVSVPLPIPSPTPSLAVTATDIAKSAYKSAIETLIQKGIMNNVALIKPNQSITRAEFLKLLSLSNGYTPVTVSKKFGDLPSSNTLAPYVNYGVSKGWVNVKNKNFRPNDIISQGEIDKLIAAIKGSATANTVAAPSA